MKNILKNVKKLKISNKHFSILENFKEKFPLNINLKTSEINSSKFDSMDKRVYEKKKKLFYLSLFKKNSVS